MLSSWSTIVLIVVFSSRISPRASTSIFLVRSPCATAVVTWAMFRTWPVRLLAIELTLSVRSFQVPDTPCTVAWPPRLPWVPTSRATLVTSSANADSWSTIVFSVVFSSRISPRASTSIFCVRSPLATAVATWAMLRTCQVRLPAIALTDSVRSFHVPETPGTFACPPSFPSLPTSRATLRHLGGELVKLIDHAVEHGRDLVDQRVAGERETRAEVAAAHGGQPREQLLKRRPVEAWLRVVNVCHRLSRSWTAVDELRID